MLLASFEVFHSRPIAPTRRVALGESELPCTPAPGPGGLLLGAVLARFADELDHELKSEMVELMDEVRIGGQIGQPRLRFRLQKDVIGLTRSFHTLRQSADGLRFSFESEKSLPEQSALAAIYAVGDLPTASRIEVMDVLRRGIDWSGPVGPGLVDYLVGRDLSMRLNTHSPKRGTLEPLSWALMVLGLDRNEDQQPKASDVQRSYRRLLRDAHPDHGGGEVEAAERIEELTRAREILLTS